jgi:uncharacterized membrane protein
MSRDGSGLQDLAEPQAIKVHSVTHGHATPDSREVARSLGVKNPKLVGATFATTSGNLYRQESSPCSAPVIQPSETKHSMMELLPPSFSKSTARALNLDGIVLGAGSTVEMPGENRLWIWTMSEGYRELGVAVTNSLEMAINAAGIVGGALSDGPTTLQPFIWNDGALRVLPGGDMGGSVGVLADDGTAAGWISLSHHTVGRGQLDYRPAVWTPDAGVLVLRDLPADWGTVLDVSPSGLCLLWMHRAMDNVVALWSIASRQLESVDDRHPGIVPVGFAGDQSIVGFGYDKAGSPFAVITARATEYARLEVPRGWIPTATNRDGWVAGITGRRGDGPSWVLSPDGAISMLPFVADHSCRPSAIATDGSVVGSATADHGSHALLWKPLDSATVS